MTKHPTRASCTKQPMTPPLSKRRTFMSSERRRRYGNSRGIFHVIPYQSVTSPSYLRAISGKHALENLLVTSTPNEVRSRSKRQGDREKLELRRRYAHTRTFL